MAKSARQRIVAKSLLEKQSKPGVTTSNGTNHSYGKWPFVMAILLTIGFFFQFYSRPSEGVVDFAKLSEQERRVLKLEETQIMANLSSYSPYTLDRFCDAANDCFLVQQQYTPSRNRLEAIRYIMYELNSAMALSIVRLRTPEIITRHHLSHENWPVAHDQLMFSYNSMQIAAGFMTGSMSFDRADTRYRVLQIGMGGGTATAFLARIPMNLEIDVVEIERNTYEAAKKWFDFPQQNNIRVHIEDGVDFAQEAVRKGATYDSIILDACSNSPTAEIVCPHPVFLNDDVIENLSKMAGPSGTLSANMYMPNTQETRQNEVRAAFSNHFRSCSGIVLNSSGQEFLLCSNLANAANWSERRKEMLAALRQFDQATGTRTERIIHNFN